MTEQSQMPLVGPPKRRGWREIVWFRPLTASTHAALVVTRRGRLVSILPAGGPRVLSDYLAWPYDFREVDTRERSLVLDQRVESFDSGHEFSVSLRLIYQVVQPDRVALDLEDVSADLAHAVVQSLRLSGRSFGVEQDKTFEQHLQETLITSDALVQRVQLLGLVLRRADVTVSLDEPTRTHAEALRFAMRERPLYFQIAVESLEPDRSFNVIVGGSYRLTDRRASDGPSDTTDSATQLAIARTLRRVGITFAPSDYLDAAKAMAEVLRKDALLQSELSMVQVQLLRPTVQIQPDRSMVHVPRPNMLPDTRPDPMLRRARQSLPRMGRPPALMDTQARAPQQVPAPAARRALPPPELPPADIHAPWALPPEPEPAEIAASQTLPLGDLPAPGDPIEGTYTLWPLPESIPVMRAQPQQGHPNDMQDAHAPWDDLISGAEDQPNNLPWSATLPATESETAEPEPWDSLALDAAAQPLPEAQESPWSATLPAVESEPAEPQLRERSALDAAAESLPEAQESPWSATLPVIESEPAEPEPWDSLALDAAAQPLPEAQESPWSATLPATENALVEPQPWGSSATDDIDQPAFGAALAAEEPWSVLDTIAGPEFVADVPGSVNNDPDDDLGFSLDWSEPEVAAPMAESPASALVPMDSAPTDELGFRLDWTAPQPDPYASVWPPNADTADDRIITAHWDDPTIVVPEPALFSESPADAAAVAENVIVDRDPASVFELDSVQFDLEQARQADLPIVAEQDAEQGEASVVIEQESLPWYAPTLHLDDHLPFDAAADNSGYALVEPAEVAWAEPPAAPSAPDYDLLTDDVIAPLVEPAEAAWAEPPTAPSAPDYNLIADAFPQLPNEALAQEPTPIIESASALVPGDANELMATQGEPVAEIPAEQIARIIGMIQSYGPAWFKMWSLELKERPERLPVVLGEVTADPILLAQAADPHVQSALLAALAAYTAPVTFPSRLSPLASLPSPAVAGQGSDGEDEVPDWLSLRVKWNGHGGGA